MGITVKPSYPMGYYLPTNLEESAAYWCLKNGIGVNPVSTGHGRSTWYVEITINGKSRKSPETYGKVEIWRKTYEFRLYYYNKFLNNKKDE